MGDVDQEAIMSFTAITDTSADVARDYLAATFNNLEQAVARYFSQAEEGLPGGASKTDEQLAQELQYGDAAALPSGVPQSSGLGGEWGGDDSVRAPIPAMTDRLYGDAALHPSRPRQRPQSQEVNAFRDFEAESQRLRGRNGQPAKGGGGLGAMFEPPKALIFKGEWDAAREHASDHTKWMLVNLQSNKEFASHRLNRDTWSNPALQDIIKGSFVFLQYEVSSQEGEQFQAYYKVYDLPALVVVDPITGGAMRTFHGFLDPARLSEELVHYMDHNPEDPAAQRKRKYSQTKPTGVSTEDEELARAMALSMDAGGGKPSSDADSDYDDSEDGGSEGSEDDGPAPQAAAEGKGVEAVASVAEPPPKDPAAVQAEALASLPQEPGGGVGGACRIRVRLPDGSNAMRSFLTSHPLEVLRTFCVASSLEAAGGRAFNIIQAGHGGPAKVFSDLSQTLGEAGLANSVVSMSWA